MEKSGFLLEVDVLNWLMQKSWTIYPQYPYIDKETKKTRTIDVLAHPAEFYESDIPKLIIECKSSQKNSWVFFVPKVVSSQGKNFSINMTVLHADINLQFSLCRAHPAYKGEKDLKKRLDTAKEIMDRTHYRSVPFANSCHVTGMNQKEDQINDFRKAVLQLNSAYEAIKKPEYLCPYFLCIVFRGKLFALDTNKKLSAIDHLVFVNLDEESEMQLHPPLIDVVSDGYFQKYLELIRNDMGICIDFIFDDNHD
jgi:hypothetical protein